MRHLDEIKRMNRSKYPDDWAGSEKPLGISPIEAALEDVRRLNATAPRILDPPPMYRYVKETFNVPDTWVDHLKITIRSYALVNCRVWVFNLVCRIFRNIKSTRIPVVYEIHAVPKIKGRRGAK
jgi:hypothetical protein